MMLMNHEWIGKLNVLYFWGLIEQKLMDVVSVKCLYVVLGW